MSLSGATTKESLKNIDSNTKTNGIGDFPIGLVRGELKDLTPASVFGFCNDLDNGQETSLVSGFSSGELLTMTTTAKNLAISSTSTDDAGAGGTGANLVSVQLLKSDGTVVSVFVTLNGQTQVSITGSADIVAVGDIIVVTFGSGAPTDATAINIGDIWVSLLSDTVTAGKPDNDLFGLAPLGTNASQSSVLLCATNQKLHFKELTLLSAINGNDTAVVMLKLLSIAGNVIFTFSFPISVGSAPVLDLSHIQGVPGGCVNWINATSTNGLNLSIGSSVSAVLDSSGIVP